MDKKKIEKAGKFISYGLRALINDEHEEQDHLSSLQLEELHQPDTFIVVRQYERNYRIEEQVKVNEFLEVDSFDDYEIYYEIYKHDDALVGKTKTADGDSASESKTPKAILNYQAMRNYVLSHKDMRQNKVTGAMEWAEKGSNEFVRIDKQEMTTMWTQLQDAGIQTDFNALQRLCSADRYMHYDPLVEFMNALPEWDGKDHAGEFLRRLTNDEHCIEGMKIWMRAITAKMIHYRSETPWANMLMPILVGAQGLKKTTFARRILPVDGFFAQNIDFSPKGDWMRKLTNYILVCDDEFDKHSDSQLATIKGAISTSEVMIRDPYAKRESSHVRLAAMIGTSNRLDLLRDDTGSRRFLVINIEHDIDLDTPIPYEQIYAQLKAELLAGEPYYPNKEFEQRNEVHNLDYHVSNMVEEVFTQHFAFIPYDKPGAQWMTATAIYETLCEAHPLLKKEKAKYSEFGKSLKPLAQNFALANQIEIKRIFMRRKEGSCYSVLRIE